MTIIDLLKMVMYKFPAEGGKPEKLPIPASEKERAEQLHNELVEKAAENDEKLMEKYFEKGTLDEDEMREGLKAGNDSSRCFSSVRHVGEKKYGKRPNDGIYRQCCTITS